MLYLYKCLDCDWRMITPSKVTMVCPIDARHWVVVFYKDHDQQERMMFNDIH